MKARIQASLAAALFFGAACEATIVGPRQSGVAAGGRSSTQTGVSSASGEGGGGGAPRGGEGGESGADVFGAPSRCTSGTYRDPNESEGPEMMPGVACNACHAQANAQSGEGDAPIFAFAGTLFPSAHEPDTCVAPEAQGALVVVRDGNGAEFSATVNLVGNFSLETSELVFPITARVISGGRERVMARPAAHGDCNLCHSLAGSFAAPGRIVLP